MSQSVFGAAAAVTMLNRAFNNSSPANAVFNNQVATAGTTAESQFAFATTFAASFNTLTDAQLAERVLGNMGVLPNDPLLTAVAEYFAATGVQSRGVVVLQLGQILAGLENATGEQAIYAPQAVAWNTEVEKSFLYSSNTSNTTAFNGDFPPAPTNPGQTFTLTTGVDAVAGTAGDDSIVGTDTTFTGLDNIDGGAGNDTLTINNPAGNTPALTLATIKNVESLVINSAANAVTADASSITGLTSLAVNQAGTKAAIDIDTKSNVTTVTVVGGTTVAVDDNGAASADKLTTVALSGNTGAATIAADTLTSLTVASTNQDATVTAAAGTRVLGLTLNNVSGGTVTDATATTLNITASGTKTTAGTVVAGAATTVSIAADEALSLTALTVGAATGLTVTGDSLVTLAAATLTALTSIDASAQTAGGVDTKAFALGTGVTFKGGAGADSIQLGATTKAITTGAGEDRVALTAGVTALGTGGSVDAGDGTADTLAFLDADDAGTATATAAFAATVSNFEVVELAGAAGAGVALNLANLDNIASVKLSADVGQALTISNMATGGKLAATVSQTGATTVGVANAAVGTTDVVNVSLAGAAAVNSGALTIADVETVNYLTDDTATTPTGIAHVSNLTAAAVKTITVAGDAGLTLTNTNTTITSFDASGVTKGTVTWTTGALAAAATIKGGADANTIVATAATKAVTYEGGAKVDTITINNAQANVINTGAGNDVIVVGTGANTINAGDGDDSITIGASVGLNTVNVGAGTDTVAFSAASSAAGAYTSITGMSAGDMISFNAFANDGGGLAAGALGAKITLGGAAGFANYLDAAAAGDGSTDAALKWFQLGGNTYLVLDNSAAATFQDGGDTVVELVGLVDLSTSTQNASYVVTLV